MMQWRHALIAGSAIILLTNAVALGGAAWNRSGEPESKLQLTQRELNRSHSFARKENSGLTLELNWRFEQTERSEYGYGPYASRWGMPSWLDRAKLAQLGFDVEKLSGKPVYGRGNRDDQKREVLLVLELDGPAWQQHLQHAKEFMEENLGKLAATPGDAEVQRKVKNIKENYQYELEKGSRLFAIDAGLDLSALRAAYPDRSRYAIVRGLIRPGSMMIEKETVLRGYISELHAERINVPLRLRQAFEEGAPYTVTVAFGQRLEPWLESAVSGTIKGNP